MLTRCWRAARCAAARARYALLPLLDVIRHHARRHTLPHASHVIRVAGVDAMLRATARLLTMFTLRCYAMMPAPYALPCHYAQATLYDMLILMLR